MEIYEASGEELTPTLFIKYYRQVCKVSPPRFLTLRLHPDKYKLLYSFAEVPESIQIGNVPGPLGRSIPKVACIKPPLGVANGMTITQDDKTDPTKLVFEVHGIAEVVIQNLK